MGLSLAELVERDGSAVEETLGAVAAEAGEDPGLVGRLHALGHGFEVQGAGEADDGGDDGPAFGGGQVGHE